MKPAYTKGIIIIFCPCSSVVEHFLGKEEVIGSIPIMGSINSIDKT